MKIKIEKYDPKWEVQFEAEKQLLLEHLKTADTVIEHIGSTSVKGLGAKPIIDIMVGIRDFNLADQQIEKLQKLGYQYISKYNEIIPERRFFIKENKGIRTHHLHLVKIGKDFWIRHLNFRDYLRNNKKDREEYNSLKKVLSKKNWRDGDEYADAKSDFIKRIEKKAGTSNTP